MKKFLVTIIRGYHRHLSPFLPSACRFTPTCSEYTAQAIEKYGSIRGLWKGALRLAKCHPFHPGGSDPLK